MESQFNEGFTDEMTIDSELTDGQVCIDGSLKYKVGFGDKLKIDVKPEYKLKCMKFIM
jgi:hypothetical protein